MLFRSDEMSFCFLATNGFHVKAENDFLCIVVIALNMKISPCCLADYTPQKKIATLAARLLIFSSFNESLFIFDIVAVAIVVSSTPSCQCYNVWVLLGIIGKLEV